MGLWSRLFGRTVKIGDAFFGIMTFMGIPNDSAQSYFECACYFKPIREKMDVMVTGSLNGPTQEQKDFFAQVETDYPRLVTKFISIIEAEFGNWMSLPIIKDFDVEFKPTLLDIPACDQEPIEWEIVFDTVHDINHIVTVRNGG